MQSIPLVSLANLVAPSTKKVTRFAILFDEKTVSGKYDQKARGAIKRVFYRGPLDFFVAKKVVSAAKGVLQRDNGEILAIMINNEKDAGLFSNGSVEGGRQRIKKTVFRISLSAASGVAFYLLKIIRSWELKGFIGEMSNPATERGATSEFLGNPHPTLEHLPPAIWLGTLTYGAKGWWDFAKKTALSIVLTALATEPALEAMKDLTNAANWSYSSERLFHGMTRVVCTGVMLLVLNKIERIRERKMREAIKFLMNGSSKTQD